MTVLKVQNLRAAYGSRQVLQDVSFSLEPHTLVGILGANGSGKTTLLRSICGITPSEGKLGLLGQDPRRLSPRALAKLCGYIPQRTGISIDLTAMDVVLMGFNPRLGLLEYPGAAMRAAAAQALEQVGLGDRGSSNFQALSEGQKQLCILARAMLTERGLLILDEPESALDFSGRYRILQLVRRWLEAREGAALVTLHDPQLALNACDRLLLLEGGVILDSIDPAQDTPEMMAEKLSRVYGSLSVHACTTRAGQRQLVLLKEG